MNSKSVMVPDCCCTCLGKAQTVKFVSKEYTSNNTVTTLSLNVPICYSCDNIRSRISTILVSVFTVAGLAIYPLARFFWGGGSSDGVPFMVNVLSILSWILPVFLCGAVGVALGTMFSRFTAPVKLKANGNIVFKNRKYQKMFIQLNSQNN